MQKYVLIQSMWDLICIEIVSFGRRTTLFSDYVYFDTDRFGW